MPPTRPPAPAAALVVLTTFESEEDAARVARVLVEEHLAACGTILPGVRSIYAWEGRVEDSREAALLVKSLPGRADALARRLRELHPYATPEVLLAEAGVGNPAYAEWLRAWVADR